MVAALVKGKRIEIENLNDLLEVVESSIREMESLVLFGDCEEPFEVGPAEILSDDEKDRLFLSTRGAWKGLVDTEQLKLDIYESRGQTPRSWMIAELDEDQE